MGVRIPLRPQFSPIASTALGWRMLMWTPIRFSQSYRLVLVAQWPERPAVSWEAAGSTPAKRTTDCLTRSSHKNPRSVLDGWYYGHALDGELKHKRNGRLGSKISGWKNGRPHNWNGWNHWRKVGKRWSNPNHLHWWWSCGSFFRQEQSTNWRSSSSIILPDSSEVRAASRRWLESNTG